MGTGVETAKDSRRGAARLALFLALACAPAGSACKSGPRGPEAPYALEIEAQNRRLEEAFRAGNLLGIADVYADDAQILDAHGTRVAGRQEIDQYWSAIEGPVEWKLTIRRLRGSEAVAYELGTSELTTRREGELHTSTNDFVVLWRRDSSGEWRIVIDAYWPTPE